MTLWPNKRANDCDAIIMGKRILPNGDIVDENDPRVAKAFGRSSGSGNNRGSGVGGGGGGGGVGGAHRRVGRAAPAMGNGRGVGAGTRPGAGGSSTPSPAPAGGVLGGIETAVRARCGLDGAWMVVACW